MLAWYAFVGTPRHLDEHEVSVQICFSTKETRGEKSGLTGGPSRVGEGMGVQYPSMMAREHGPKFV